MCNLVAVKQKNDMLASSMLHGTGLRVFCIEMEFSLCCFVFSSMGCKESWVVFGLQLTFPFVLPFDLK
jgi:hypothetical protein